MIFLISRYKKHICDDCYYVKGDIYFNVTAKFDLFGKKDFNWKLFEIGYPFTITVTNGEIYSALQQNIQKMRRRNFKEQGKLLKAYFRMVRKFDAVIWNLYKHLWIFCCSAEYNKSLMGNLTPHYMYQNSDSKNDIRKKAIVILPDDHFEDTSFAGAPFEFIDLSKTNIKTLTGTFGNCINLTEVILPSTLTTITDHCFQECKNLKYITSLRI